MHNSIIFFVARIKICVVGIELEWSSTLTFNHCLGFGIKNYVEAMTAISESAAKEYSIELSLNKMMNEWEEVNFEISPYKMTGNMIMIFDTIMIVMCCIC